MPLLASRDLPLVANGRLYSTRVRSIMIYGSETSPVKEENLIRLDRNDARMGRWMFNVGPKDRISAEKLRIRLRSNSSRECLQDRRLQWFGLLERMEERKSAGT